MKQDKTESSSGLRGLIDELYALASRRVASVIQSVTGTLPIVITGPASNPNVTIDPATDTTAGSMSAADKTKLDNLVVAPGVEVIAGPTAPATTQTVQASVTVGASGSIIFGGMMGPAQSGGSTAPTTDVVEATPQLDGSALPGGSIVGVAASEMNKACSIAPPLSRVNGLVPGSVHTVGYLMDDVTTPTNTFLLPGAGSAGVFWWSP